MPKNEKEKKDKEEKDDPSDKQDEEGKDFSDLSDDPKEKRRCEHEIAELRQLLDSYQSERTMVNQRDGASVAQMLVANVTTTQTGDRVLELEGDLAREIVTVLKQIRDNAVEFNSLVEALRQQGITITGDGNIVGSNNQVIVVKDSPVQDVIQEISSIVRAREIEFVNRENELHLLRVERLRASRSPYTLISAPAGYGKSYLLQRLIYTITSDETLRQKWCVRYVNFGTQVMNQIAHVVRITSPRNQVLSEKPGLWNEPDTATDLVCDTVVQELSTPLPEGRRAVLLIFDAVEQLEKKARQWLYTLLDDLRKRTRPGHQEIITVRVIIAGRNVELFWEGYQQVADKLPAPQRISLSPFDEHPIQELIWGYAQAVQVDLDDQTVIQMADELLYLSGGHPGVIRRLVDNLASQSFAIGPASQYFSRHRGRLVRAVLSPVAGELLGSLEASLGTEMREAVRTLSVFRRVNANTVQVLVEASALPPRTNEIDLLGDMQRAHLLDGPGIREPFYRDHLRRYCTVMVTAMILPSFTLMRQNIPLASSMRQCSWSSI